MPVAIGRRPTLGGALHRSSYQDLCFRYFALSASALEVYPFAIQGFHFSTALWLPSQPPSEGFTNVPLASLAQPRPPAGRPSLIGQYETVTVAPGSKVLPVRYTSSATEFRPPVNVGDPHVLS